MDFSLLLMIAIALPLVGAGVVCALGDERLSAVRWVALAATVATVALAFILVLNFPGDDQPFAVSDWSWLGEGTGFDVRLSVGIDGLSLWLFALSALLMITCVLASWDAISERTASFYGLLLLLECGLLGVFTARDIILFYIFFEFTLIPLFLLIGVWGSEDRRYAAIKFFIFTLAGSVLTFLGLIAIVLWNYRITEQLTFSIPALTESLSVASQATDPEMRFPAQIQLAIFLALFAGFAIKVPLFPLHTWLPLAHTQAPTAGSVVLAGVLLKIGTYGFLRFCIPMLPDATVIAAPYLLWLSVAGIIYGALVALVQADMKRLIAYSSVSHLGYCMLGIFALNRLGIQGGTLQMINHGLSTGGLFACVGMVYSRYHTRQISELGGLAKNVPVLAFFMLVFTLASIGLPGLNGFAGEFLILVGMFQRAWTTPELWRTQFMTIAVLSVFGVVLGAWYMLWLYKRTFFGPAISIHHDDDDEDEAEHEPVRDLAWYEISALAPLVVFIVWIGIRPTDFLRPMDSSLNSLTAGAIERYQPHIEDQARLAGTVAAGDANPEAETDSDD